MVETYTMNGIIGVRPVLSYSAIKERCSARIRGHDQVMAHLPFETVDAVFTSRGLLIHRNVRDELQAVSIPDHENLWKIACGTGDNAAGKNAAGSIEPDSANPANVRAEDAWTFEQIRMIAPLTARIEELRRQNQRLVDKIQSLEDRDAQGNKPEAAGAQEFKGEAVERQWGENGGLPTFLHEPGNPFRKPRR